MEGIEKKASWRGERGERGREDGWRRDWREEKERKVEKMEGWREREWEGGDRERDWMEGWERMKWEGDAFSSAGSQPLLLILSHFIPSAKIYCQVSGNNWKMVLLF